MTESSTGAGIPEIEQLAIHTALIGTTPVVILLPRVRGVHIAPTGALVTTDSWTSAIRAYGAEPMLDMEFASPPAAGWRVTVNVDMSTIRVEGPAGLGEVGRGELVCDHQWRTAVELDLRDRGGLVMVTGTASGTGPDAALEMMERGRAVWVRSHVEVRPAR